MRRFAKPLYGLTPVPRVRIPPSPPDVSTPVVIIVYLTFPCESKRLGDHYPFSVIVFPEETAEQVTRPPFQGIHEAWLRILGTGAAYVLRGL